MFGRPSLVWAVIDIDLGTPSGAEPSRAEQSGLGCQTEVVGVRLAEVQARGSREKTRDPRAWREKTTQEYRLARSAMRRSPGAVRDAPLGARARGERRRGTDGGVGVAHRVSSGVIECVIGYGGVA